MAKAKNYDYIIGQKFGKLTVNKILYKYKVNNKSGTYCECKCECGNTKIISIYSILRGATKSCGCVEKSSRYTRQHCLELEGQRFGHLTVIKRLRTNHQGRVIWQCKCDCGNLTEVTSTRLKLGRTRSCGCNKRSKHEEWTQEVLKEHEIDFVPEYKFIECRNYYPLPFDFYLPKYNICIECQGQQHYISVEHFGGDERFEKQKQNDKIKKEYCETHGIFLLELNYKLNKQQIEKEIMNILDPVTITV
mgnify:CR=1 FL=1